MFRSIISYGPGTNTNKSTIIENREMRIDNEICPHCKSESLIENREVFGKEILDTVSCYKCGWRGNNDNKKGVI